MLLCEKCCQRKLFDKEEGEKMHRSRWRIYTVSIALSAAMIFSIPAGSVSAFAASKVGDSGELGGNLLNFPVANAQKLREDFNTGNLFLFPASLFPKATDSISTPAATDGGVQPTADNSGEGDDSEVDTPEDPEIIATVARVVGSSVKMFTAATADSPIAADLSDGVTLSIIEKNGQWLHVSFGIIQGYVKSTNVFQVLTVGMSGYIMRDGINFRSESNTDALVLETLSAGTGVQVLDYSNGWYRVMYNGKYGYVRSDCIVISGAFSGTQTTLLKGGMSGNAVKQAQSELKRRGFYVGIASGDYGSETIKAVEAFQAMANLDSDGILGSQTIGMLYGSNNIKLTVSIAQKVGVKGKVKLTDWSRANGLIPNGAKFKVIDVRTGVSWYQVRSCGHYHMDCDTASAADTAKLKSVYGGRWTWARRPIWVVYRGYVFAASMNGMPHALNEKVVSGNNFPGVNCIHFLNSRIHATGKIDPVHQSCIRSAYNAGK